MAWRRCYGRLDGAFRFIQRVIGDGGYQEPKMAAMVTRTGA
jgi:hypothetical protein